MTFLTLLSCNNRHKTNNKKTNLDSSVISKPVNKIERKSTQYSDQQLETFLDSIGQLPTQPLADTTAFEADSIFKNQLQLDSVISLKDFNILKYAARKGVIAVNTARRIFGNNDIDSNCNEESIFLTYKKGLIPVVYFPFDKKKDFNEFAICIGDPEHCGNAYLYFFKANRIIARHNGYNRDGLELKHYKDMDGKTVVYYSEEFDRGSGIWWFNFFFYKYDGNKLMPILNELENGNLQQPSPWGFRTLWLESFVQKTNPLIIKMVYYGQFPDTTKAGVGTRIIDDSTSVQYIWNEQSKTLEGQYGKSKISKAQVLSYYLGKNDFLFINSYYKTLKSSLLDTAKRKSTLNYLNEVRNYYNNN